jgi:hypothetical protein
MTTLAEWIADVRSEVDGNRGERFNRLAIDYIPGSGSLTLLRDLNGIGPNTLVTVGLNTLLVEATSATAKTLTVIGGFNGSPDSAASTGDLVRVGPRFTDHRILRALNNALASMSNPKAGLFAVGTSVLALALRSDSWPGGRFRARPWRRSPTRDGLRKSPLAPPRRPSRRCVPCT